MTSMNTDPTAAYKPFEPKTGEAIAEMANAFLRWPLPESVRVDACCLDTKAKHRTGTNLLTVIETLQMLQQVVCPIIAKHLAQPVAPILPNGASEGKDAERYRFLRLNWDSWTGQDWSGSAEEIASKLDAAIDESMRGSKPGVPFE